MLKKLIIIGFLFISCTHTGKVSQSEKTISETKEAPKEVSKSENIKSEMKEASKSAKIVKSRIVVSVPGMVCQMCVQGMKKAFKDCVKDPEKDISVNLDTKQVTLNPNKKLPDSEIKKRIKNAGYNAKDIKRI